MSLFQYPNVCIVGIGYVGKAMFKFFKDHYPVKVYDVNPNSYTEEMKPFIISKEEVNNCDVVVVCVSTPMAKDGGCDLSHVESVFSWLKAPLVILKSTVTPGTTEKLKKEKGLRIVHQPEYISESTYNTPYKFHTDVKETPWFIFGGDIKDTNEAVNLYLPIIGPAKFIREVDSTTSEITKYVENVFYSMKVLFCYEIANICNLAGVNYNTVRDLWTLDPRLSDGKMHTAVFEKNDAAFSGKCFPKDINSFVKYAESLNYNAGFIKEAIDSNKRIGEYRRKKRLEKKVLANFNIDGKKTENIEIEYSDPPQLTIKEEKDGDVYKIIKQEWMPFKIKLKNTSNMEDFYLTLQKCLNNNGLIEIRTYKNNKSVEGWDFKNCFVFKINDEEFYIKFDECEYKKL